MAVRPERGRDYGQTATATMAEIDTTRFCCNKTVGLGKKPLLTSNLGHKAQDFHQAHPRHFCTQAHFPVTCPDDRMAWRYRLAPGQPTSSHGAKLMQSLPPGACIPSARTESGDYLLRLWKICRSSRLPITGEGTLRTELAPIAF
jgi:hypothetical protein